MKENQIRLMSTLKCTVYNKSYLTFSCIQCDIKIEGKILNPTNDSIEFKIFSVFFVQI